MKYQRRGSREQPTTPQGGAGTLFTIAGRVNILEIIGEVTTQIGAGANNMKLVSNPTVGDDVDICATVDIDGAAVGTVFHITGTQANAMIATTSGSYESQPGIINIPAGTIDLNCDGSTTGSIKWTLLYENIDENSSAIAA